MQGVVGEDGVADCRDVGEGDSVAIPDKVSVKLFLDINLLGKSDCDKGDSVGLCWQWVFGHRVI